MPHTDFQPILVAHGTRSPHGVNTVARLADLVADRIGPTRVAFVDVLGPSPTELLGQTERPALIVPAFLASGYHVRTDIPARRGQRAPAGDRPRQPGSRSGAGRGHARPAAGGGLALW
ncbi:MAG: CbiX/SirB N-terminal domain-containing protein [Nakamurella multipartita]